MEIAEEDKGCIPPVIGGPKVIKNGHFVCLPSRFLLKLCVATGTFPMCDSSKHVQFCFLIQIDFMQFQENPMLLLVLHRQLIHMISLGGVLRAGAAGLTQKRQN